MSHSSRSARALLLFTEVLAKGGIQRFNQTFLKALEVLSIPGRVLSLNDPLTARMTHPAIDLQGFEGNRKAFLLEFVRILATQRFEFLVVGHVNFVSIVHVALGLCPWRHPRTVFVAHGIEVWSGIGPLRRHALGQMHRILCVSQYTRSRLLDQAPGLEPGRLAVFPNALAESWARIVPAPVEHPLPSKFILSVTRLEPGDRYKGIATVIEALAMVTDPDVHYVIVGHGMDIPFLEVVARRFEVTGRVHFLTGIADTQLASLFRRCLAFVLPSGKEGFGIVFLEAMYFSTPVIAACEKGARDVVTDGENGLSVAFGDVIGIKRAIERLAADEPLRERLRARGHEMVTGDGPFTFRRFTERCSEALLDRPLAASAAPGRPLEHLESESR